MDKNLVVSEMLFKYICVSYNSQRRNYNLEIIIYDFNFKYQHKAFTVPSQNHAIFFSVLG